MKHLKIRQILNHDLFPFFILGISMFLFHLLIKIPVADDIYFRNQPQGLFDWSFYKDRYFTWSSRLVIEFFVVGFLKFSSVIWRIINPIVIVLLAISISKIFINSNKYILNWFITFLIILFPFKEVMSAGWVTMSVNYLWTISFGVSFLVVIKKIIVDDEISGYEYFISSVFLFFSINHEIMCVLLLLILLSTSIYLVYRKRNHWFVYFSLVLCIISLIFILTAPGNQVRRSSELKWFIDFNNISLVDKLEIGLSSAFSKCLFNFNFIYFFFSLFLFISIWNKYQDGLYKVYSIIPLMIGILFGNVAYVIVDRMFPYLANLDTEMSKYGLITLQNFTQIQSYIPFFILYATILIVFILFYLLFDNEWQSFIAIGILILGILSRVIVAFSPTVWASGARTYSYLFISLILCSIMILKEIIRSHSLRFTENLLIILSLVAGISYLNLLMSV